MCNSKSFCANVAAYTQAICIYTEMGLRYSIFIFMLFRKITYLSLLISWPYANLRELDLYILKEHKKPFWYTHSGNYAKLRNSFYSTSNFT